MEDAAKKRWLRRLVKLVLVGVVAVLVVAALPERTVEVRVVEVRRGPVERLVTSTQAGEVKARRRVSIRAATIGRVARVYITKGQRVEAGQLLVELDNSTLRARLRLARANLEVGRSGLRSAEVRLRSAASALARSTKLAHSGALSSQSLERVQAEHDLAVEAVATARANVAQLEASVGVAQAALEESRIRAPFGGQVVKVHVEEGEALVAGAPVAELVDDGQVTVLAPVDEADAGSLRVELPVRVLCDAFAGQTFAGKLIWIAPVVSRDVRQNRHLEVEVGFDGQRVPLKPGMSADIEVILERHEQTLWVPTNAVMRRDGGQEVFVVTGGRARLREITTGISNWERTEVTDGLREGERVIVSLESRGLQDGVKVRLGELGGSGQVAW